MGVEKVNQVVKRESLQELKNLLFMIKTACKMAGLEVRPIFGGQISEEEKEKAIGFEEDWIGWWCKKGEEEKANYWCGIYFEEPTKVGFGVTEDVYRELKQALKKNPDLKEMLKKEFDWQDYYPENCGELFFTLPQDFTSRKMEEQLHYIHEKIQEVLGRIREVCQAS